MWRKKFEIEKTFFCTPAVRKAINLKEQKKWQVGFSWKWDEILQTENFHGEPILFWALEVVENSSFGGTNENSNAQQAFWHSG